MPRGRQGRPEEVAPCARSAGVSNEAMSMRQCPCVSFFDPKAVRCVECSLLVLQVGHGGTQTC